MATKNDDKPKCPECGADANRPKCLWELGGDCPRHKVMAEYRKRQRDRKNKGNPTN